MTPEPVEQSVAKYPEYRTLFTPKSGTGSLKLVRWASGWWLMIVPTDRATFYVNDEEAESLIRAMEDLRP